MPKRNIGVTIMPTMGSALTDIVLFSIFDRLLGLDQVDWTARKRKERDDARLNQQPQVSDQIKGTSPSQALEAFCSEYRHDAYGKFLVKLDEKGLYIEDDGHNNYMRHYHYDTFELMEQDGEAFCKATFHTDAKGVISSVSAPFEPAVDDIVFKRRP